MKLEAGKTYLNRLGGRVRVEADPVPHGPYFFIGSDGYYRMADGGIYTLGSECEQDLIAEAPEVVSAVPAKRKIVQIASCDRKVLALCNDGSVWAYGETGDGQIWERVRDIPQDAP